MSSWEEREKMEQLRLKLKILVAFVNEMENHSRSSVASLQQRIDSLEKQIGHLEGGLDRSFTNTL